MDLASFNEGGTWVERRGARLWAYHREGSPVLLLLHGLSGTASSWLPMMEHLPEDYGLVVPDLRGHGFSSKQNCNLRTVVEDLDSMIGGREVIAVGHCYGCLPAAGLMQERDLPGVFIQAHPAPAMKGPVLLAWYKLLALLPLPERYEHFDYKRFNNHHSFDPARYLRSFFATGSKVLHACLEEGIDHRNLWPALKQRALVLHGDNDPFFPFQECRQHSGLLSCGEWTRLPGGNHVCILQKPREIAEHVVEFAEGHFNAGKEDRGREKAFDRVQIED